MIVQLSVTADCCQQKLFGLGAMADDRRAVRYKLEDCGGLFCSLPSLGFFSSNHRFPRCCDADNTQPQFVGCVLHWQAL